MSERDETMVSHTDMSIGADKEQEYVDRVMAAAREYGHAVEAWALAVSRSARNVAEIQSTGAAMRAALADVERTAVAERHRLMLVYERAMARQAKLIPEFTALDFTREDVQNLRALAGDAVFTPGMDDPDAFCRALAARIQALLPPSP